MSVKPLNSSQFGGLPTNCRSTQAFRYLNNHYNWTSSLIVRDSRGSGPIFPLFTCCCMTGRPKAHKSPGVVKIMAKAKSGKSAVVPMERRGIKEDRRQQQIPVASERRKTPRRRQIDPTTCEREYTDEEVEFMQAMDAYKRSSGRMFPTCSEILEVIRHLGYERTMRTASITVVESEAVDSTLVMA